MGKEIIIDGTTSDWFEKATFILKEDHKETLPKDLTRYAEEIIECHMKCVPLPHVGPPIASKYNNFMAYSDSKAYQEAMKREKDKLKNEREKIRKRARYVNLFVTLSIIACILSLIALAFS